METAEAYRLLRERILDLALAADPTTPVPTCPGWTVKELLAHVTGVAADVVGGNIAEAGTDPWVEVQVAARRDLTVEEIADAVTAQTGIEIDRRHLHLDEPIKSVGTHLVPAKLHAEVEFPITVEVVAS